MKNYTPRLITISSFLVLLALLIGSPTALAERKLQGDIPANQSINTSKHSVYLASHYQYAHRINPRDPNRYIWGIVANFQNDHKKSETVILSLSLHNQEGQKLKEALWQATIQPNTHYTHQLTTNPDLPPGNYYWNVTVANKKGKLLQSYYRVDEFQIY